MGILLLIVVWLKKIDKEDIRSYGQVKITEYSNLDLEINPRWQMMELMMEANQQQDGFPSRLKRITQSGCAIRFVILEVALAVICIEYLWKDCVHCVRTNALGLIVILNNQILTSFLYGLNLVLLLGVVKGNPWLLRQILIFLKWYVFRAKRNGKSRVLSASLMRTVSCNVSHIFVNINTRK